MYLRSSIATLDAKIEQLQGAVDNTWSLQAKQVENLSSKERLIEDFRKEFQILDRNISKLYEDQASFSISVGADIQALKGVSSNNSNSSGLDLVHSRIGEIESAVGTGFEEMNKSFHNILSKIINKADREEVMQTISDQIYRLKRNLLQKELNQQDGESAVGIVSCITCGKGKQKLTSPPRARSTELENDSMNVSTSGYDRLNLSLSEESYSREDYEQVWFL